MVEWLQQLGVREIPDTHSSLLATSRLGQRDFPTYISNYNNTMGFRLFDSDCDPNDDVGNLVVDCHCQIISYISQPKYYQRYYRAGKLSCCPQVNRDILEFAIDDDLAYTTSYHYQRISVGDSILTADCVAFSCSYKESKGLQVNLGSIAWETSYVIAPNTCRFVNLGPLGTCVGKTSTWNQAGTLVQEDNFWVVSWDTHSPPVKHGPQVTWWDNGQI